jgi:alpha/beta superfamily hydrolase
MHNNVVNAVCEALFRQSIAALRFNFRGAGGSGGTFGGGIGEQEDVKAALTFLRSRYEIDTGRIGLVGYSFGASITLQVAIEDEGVALLALISPALGKPGWEQLKTYRKPKFLIVGEADSFVPLGEFKEYSKTTGESEQCEIVSGTDHFWWGKERELAQKVTRFFATGFNVR